MKLYFDKGTTPAWSFGFVIDTDARGVSAGLDVWKAYVTLNIVWGP